MCSVSEDPLIPTPRDGGARSSINTRRGRGWQLLFDQSLDPEYERHPAAVGLHQLADLEVHAVYLAHRTQRKARMLTTAGTALTVLALVLAATAGFGSLGDLVGQKTTAVIALLSAVTSAVSAFVQSKGSGDALRTEAQIWRHQADDVLYDLVEIVSRLPMPASRLREQASKALRDARDRDPTRPRSQVQS